MQGLRALVSTLALGAAATAFAPAAEAGHVVVGIGLPGIAVYAPGPVVVAPPPYYYAPGYYAPGYYGPSYAALPLYGYGYYGRPYLRYAPGRAYFHGHEGRRWR
jgi:hypothetical protein